ncbi:unnamed protein product [Dicrocoelium dendriticum]|nr:unnamed protein product [Dicrocoelium dendriticum]
MDPLQPQPLSCVAEFTTSATAFLGVGTFIMVLLTLFKLINNSELKYRLHYGSDPPRICCAPLPHAKPGLSWDP